MNHRFHRRKQLLIGTGVLVALTGCTQVPLNKASVPAAKFAPVYRVQQPVGTAAGQHAVGRMEMAAGRLDAAINRFRQALQLDPAFVDAYNGLGVVYGQQGLFPEAVAAFQAALTHAPNAPHLLNNLGYAQMKAGNHDEAWAALARAYRLDKTNPQTRENLVLLATARAAAAPAALASAASGPMRPASTERASLVVGAPAAADLVVTPVTSPSAPLTGLHGAVLVQSDPARLHQFAPGILELQPTADRGAIGSASAAAPAPAASVAAVRVASFQMASMVPAAVAAPPAARLASTGGIAAVDGFEVSNGVGVRHLAGRMARALRELGVSVDRVSDYRWFGVRRSELHYREGHRDAALTVAGTLPVKPRFVRSKNMQESINVRLVVGRDLSASQVAWLGEENLHQADLADEANPIAVSAGSGGLAAQSMARLASTESGRGWRYF